MVEEKVEEDLEEDEEDFRFRSISFLTQSLVKALILDALSGVSLS